ncbi:hypothetical protein M1512_01050 [Patescibacteria group bacterium]|nr:hypothetical protein [Patescibacteria group bacterium]
MLNGIIKNNKKEVGRPRAITPEVVRELIGCFRYGCNIKTACILSGISTSTYYSEIAKNKKFSDKMTIAQNETTVIANILVQDAIKIDRDVKIAMWWIDRQDRLEKRAQRAKEYKLINKITLTDKHEYTKSVRLDLS